MKAIYLHGFASGPKSAKAVSVKKRLEAEGIECLVPDLNVPDFEHLRPTEGVALAAGLVDGPCVVAGSSLGGLMALHVAARDERVKAVVVCCPALAAEQRWRIMIGEPELERWRREGAREFFNFVTMDDRPVDFGFFEDLIALGEPAPPRVPVTLIHGRRDDVVPLALSEELARRYPERVSLTIVDDDHSLLRHKELVDDAVLAAVRSISAGPGRS